jgi:hypothetical protein
VITEVDVVGEWVVEDDAAVDVLFVGGWVATAGAASVPAEALVVALAEEAVGSLG